MRATQALVLFVIVWVAGCAGIDTTPAPNPIASPSATQVASPLATPLALASPLGVPQEPIPEQKTDLALIEGTIGMEEYPPGQLPAYLYLGDPTGSQPVGAYVALNVDTAPKGYVKPDGSFIFPNVPKGTYAIAVWTPTGAYMVPDPSTGQTWIIEIKGTERFDTGHIEVPKLQ